MKVYMLSGDTRYEFSNDIKTNKSSRNNFSCSLLALVATTVIIITTTAYAQQDETGTGLNAEHFGGVSNLYHYVAYGDNALGQQGR